MRFVVLRLVAHPDTPCRAVESIEARVERASSHLSLAYTVHGDLARIRVPAPRPAAFVDELWRHTCFEAFLSRGRGYDEFNFSPSSEYAAYEFAGYRAGRKPLDAQVAVAWREGVLSSAVPVRAETSRIGLSAIIEDADGQVSYWALNHPAGKPDFHHPDAFALKLDEAWN